MYGPCGYNRVILQDDLRHMRMMKTLRLALASLVLGIWGVIVAAQSPEDIVWVQIEAHPSLQVATERARAFAGDLQDVNGFTLGGGWYGIALGPYRRADAELVLRSYRAEGRIPSDSYLAASESYGQQFWPVGANVLNRGVLETPLPGTVPPETQTVETETVLPDETPAEARRSERALSRAEREDLQIALQWAGYYTAAIDGAFGPGTRRSMADWQSANGFDPTGILTTAQRAALLTQYNAVLDGLGLALVQDMTAGIEMLLPRDVVTFDRYEYPFAHYTAQDGSDAQVLLISQAGDQDTLFGLYEIMQTLEIVPLTGPRERKAESFTLVGENDRIVSYTEAVLREGEIKGFTLVWPRGDEARRTRLLQEMRDSFTQIDGVLDPSWSNEEAQAVDLVSGLQVRQPKRTRSGFFVDARGTVVTALEAVQSCARITLDEVTDARVRLTDDALGVAVLEPQSPIAPRAVAEFASHAPRLLSEVAVSGFSYGGLLGAPTMSFGALAELSGLRGESELTRLEVETLDGDVGGPVFDQSGAVLGMLLPKDGGTRQLPSQVNFAADGDIIQAVLVAEGVATQTRTDASRMPPEDITEQGRNMTVLVSCWE